MKTAVIFDLDGTLLNTLEDLLNATNYVLRELGYPPRTLEELRHFVGNGAENQIRKSMPEGCTDEQVREALDIYKPYYTEHCRVLTRPYDGVCQALAELRKERPLAIVSNKPDGAVKALCGELFPGIPAFGETPQCPRKPAPDMVFRGMEAIGAEKAIYVGDSEVDLATARNAKIPCLSVLWGFREKQELVEAGARHFCERPEELPRALEQLEGTYGK